MSKLQRQQAADVRIYKALSTSELSTLANAPGVLTPGDSSRMFRLFILSVMRVNPDVLARALQQLAAM
jgi:hypothetical protein